MKENIVRIQKTELHDFKNTGHGIIPFTCSLNSNIFEDKADILGIYGQNGSGKTTLIYALELFKNLIMGKALGKESAGYIRYGAETARCKFELSIINEENLHYQAFYEFELKKMPDKGANANRWEPEEHSNEDSNVSLSYERLSLAKQTDGKWSKHMTILEYREDAEQIQSARSFLFSKQLQRIIQSSNIEAEHVCIFQILQDYVTYNLHIVGNAEAGMINANIVLPFSFVVKDDEQSAVWKGKLSLHGTSQIPERFYQLFERKVNTVNIVLKELVPGLTISLKVSGRRFVEAKEEVLNVQLAASRGQMEIPLQYESDGIKRLVSMLYILIMVYNNPSTTLVVDEFDSGIFEYLLGEILKVVQTNGRGQLIFTSHNLRPLEVLDRKNILFTTTNEDNRYIRMKNVNTRHNLRDVYFRDIILGGQQESLYEETNPYLIRRAFGLAKDEDA